MKRVVLFSGGMDSTAALAWASQPDGGAHALFVYYGQPAAQREVERAIAVCKSMAIPFHRLDLASAYYGGAAQGLFMPVSAGIDIDKGTDKGFVPVRNPLLLTAAAAYALVHFPGESIQLVIGCNRDDVRGFPDCRGVFLDAMQRMLDLAIGPSARVSISSPWLGKTKAEVITWVRDYAPGWYTILFESWSCYRAKGPCGECNACVTRGLAIDTVSAPNRDAG